MAALRSTGMSSKTLTKSFIKSLPTSTRKVKTVTINGQPVRVRFVDLRKWDIIVISTSGGKDSQAMLDAIVELAERFGVRDRLVCVHADLGRVEWEGARELAETQAAHYSIPFIVVSRTGTLSGGQMKWTQTGRNGGASCHGQPLYAKGTPFGDLLDHVEHRAAQLRSQGNDPIAWYSAASRYCTADHKRGPIGKAFTALANTWRNDNGESRPCRILDCQGLRAQEGHNRAKKGSSKVRTSTKTQHVETWLPIQDWSTEDVWARIKAAGTPHHEAYDLGMPRLSCVFCCYATREGLTLAGQHNRELLDEYVRVEQEMGFSFKPDVSLAQIKADIEAGVKVNPMSMEDWSDGGCSG